MVISVHSFSFSRLFFTISNLIMDGIHHASDDSVLIMCFLSQQYFFIFTIHYFSFFFSDKHFTLVCYVSL